MAEADPQEPTTQPDASTEPASAVASTYSPEYVAQLENYYRQTSPVFEEIQGADPDDVLDYVRNKDRREFSKQSWEFYQKGAKNENQLPPEMQALKQSILDEIKPMMEKPYQYVQALEQQQADAQKQAQKENHDANMQYFQKLQQDPIFKGEPGKLERVIKYGVANNLSLEAAHKDLYAEADRPKDAEPTTTRSQDGEAGIPKKPNRTTERYQSDFHGALVGDITAARRNSRAS